MQPLATRRLDFAPAVARLRSAEHASDMAMTELLQGIDDRVDTTLGQNGHPVFGSQDCTISPRHDQNVATLWGLPRYIDDTTLVVRWSHEIRRPSGRLRSVGQWKVGE
jgi:hypothetical protein